MSPLGSENWQTTAAAWLLDLLPEFRQYPAARQYPVVLAFLARHVLNGAVEGARRGIGHVRTELRGAAPPQVITAAPEDFRTEGHRLSTALRAVELVERALREG